MHRDGLPQRDSRWRLPVKKESSTFGLKPDQLARLWTLGSEPDATAPTSDHDQEKTDLLYDRLAEKIPLEQVMAQVLPQALAQLCQEIKPFSDHSFGALLTNPATDIHVLRAIKNYHKKKVAGSEAEHDTAAVIYYAAIANALVWHQQQITSFSFQHLAVKYATLKQWSWVPTDLIALFAEALTFCQARLSRDTE